MSDRDELAAHNAFCDEQQAEIDAERRRLEGVSFEGMVIACLRELMAQKAMADWTASLGNSVSAIPGARQVPFRHTSELLRDELQRRMGLP